MEFQQIKKAYNCKLIYFNVPKPSDNFLFIFIKNIFFNFMFHYNIMSNKMLISRKKLISNISIQKITMCVRKIANINDIIGMKNGVN